MPLITREAKGSKLTIQEMDGNLEYLDSLGVEDIQIQDKTIILERPTETKEIPISLNSPGISKAIMGTSEQTGDVVFWRGYFDYSLIEASKSFPVSTNGYSIPMVYGRSYYITSNLAYCLGTTCKRTNQDLNVVSSSKYNPAATFNIGTGTGNNISRNIVLQPDGKIILGGWFSSFNGETASRIVRINSDGSRDASFNPGGGGFNSSPRAIELYPNGKILVGGQFTTYLGATQNYIVRINSDGSIDPSLNIGTGFNGNVSDLHIFSDGRILAVGDFTQYKGNTHNRIVMLNSDGSVNGDYDFGTGFNDRVNVVTVQSDGKILAGGWFTQYQGNSFNKIVRLNPTGSIDATFNIGTGFQTSGSNPVNDIVVQPDGKILVAGRYISYQGETAGGLIRLNQDGSKDTSFVGTSFASGAINIALLSDGKMFIGGRYGSFNGNTNAKYLVKLNPDGTLDESFSLSAGASIVNNWIRMVKVQPDGKVLVGSWSGLFRFTSTGANDVLYPKFISSNSGGFFFNSTNDVLTLTLPENTERGVMEFEVIEISYINPTS